MANLQATSSRVQDNSKKDSFSGSTDSSTKNDRRQSLLGFWGSIKKATDLKRRSLPDVFRRTDKVAIPSSSPFPTAPKQSRRTEDIEAAAFGDALMGLMKRNERSRKLLCDSTLKEFDRRGRRRRNSN
ncbi:hypothetical protein MMC34_006488 [Xylographa carneopallida]|nr:hypothetical protein [Xylographa carneopallida]